MSNILIYALITEVLEFINEEEIELDDAYLRIREGEEE